MRLRGHVYRIASRFPDGNGTEWVGQAWAWDLIDLDTKIVRIDAMPTIIDHGYADNQATALEWCCAAIRMRRTHEFGLAAEVFNARRRAEADVIEPVPESTWQKIVSALTGR